MTILLNPIDHPVGTRLILKYPDFVEPISFRGRLYEASIAEWSPEGRIKIEHHAWSEPKDALVVEVLP
jgi:hypothetical protein